MALPCKVHRHMLARRRQLDTGRGGIPQLGQQPTQGFDRVLGEFADFHLHRGVAQQLADGRNPQLQDALEQFSGLRKLHQHGGIVGANYWGGRWSRFAPVNTRRSPAS